MEKQFNLDDELRGAIKHDAVKQATTEALLKVGVTDPNVIEAMTQHSVEIALDSAKFGLKQGVGVGLSMAEGVSLTDEPRPTLN